MRVRLLTYHFSDNFGALMQAYALRQWFLRRGFDTEFINYHPRYVEEGGDFDQLFSVRKCRKNLTILYMKLMYLRRRLFGNHELLRALDSFRREQLGVKGPRLENTDQLSDQVIGDLLVCGSDQIWNPSVQHGLDPAYFLAFDVPGKVRRISYAASFGKSSLDSEYQEQAARLLSSLDGVSVREESGVGIVREVVQKDAACVPDPTILLGDFSELLKTTAEIQSDHVFCYALRTGEVIADIAKVVGEELQVGVVSPYNSHRRWPEIGSTIYPSPAEWLQYLNKASFVVSNSFHGVALSILLQKPFAAIALPGKKRGLNERVLNLLNQVGLRDRFIDTGDKDRVKELMERKINWIKTDKRLEEIRTEGSDFLEKEIDSIEY